MIIHIEFEHKKIDVLVFGKVSVENLFEKSAKIIPLLAGVLKKTNSEIKRTIQQGGVKYVQKDELKTLTENILFVYGEFKVKYGKKMWRKIIIN